MMEMEYYIQQLVYLLRGFAYVSMVLALLHAIHDYRAGQNVTKYLVYLICLTAFLAFYEPIIDYGCQIFDQGVSEARKNTNAVLDDIGDAISRKSFSVSSLVEKYILLPCTKGMLYCCRLFHFISGFVRNMYIVIYRVTAPLAIGLAAWRVFLPTGIRFAAGTLWVCTWSVGCAIADILLLKILVGMLAKAILAGAEGAAGAAASKALVAGAGKTAAAAIGSGVLWGILFALILFLLVCIMIYILMPIALYHIICAGDVVQGATHAMAGAIGGGMAMNQAIGRTFSHSQSKGGSGGGQRVASSDSNTAGNSAGSSGHSGSSGNTRANRSHAALAEAAERQLQNRV